MHSQKYELTYLNPGGYFCTDLFNDVTLFLWMIYSQIKFWMINISMIKFMVYNPRLYLSDAIFHFLKNMKDTPVLKRNNKEIWNIDLGFQNNTGLQLYALKSKILLSTRWKLWQYSSLRIKAHGKITNRNLHITHWM